MSTTSKLGASFTSEQDVQDWLETVVRSGEIQKHIQGKEKIGVELAHWSSPDFWPSFPVDYLTRKGCQRAAQNVLTSLGPLDLIVKNNRNMSAERGERLFTDLLYCKRDTSQFIIIEVKNQNTTAREAITELLAYEHEVLNHLPFAGANDIMMVIVSRDFSTLLDHAVAGLNTWSRRNVLCLRFDDSGIEPLLDVHIPKAWTSMGQAAMPDSAIVTAFLSFRPEPGLTEDQVYAVCDTATQLIVREAERSGGSGFAFIAYNHFYPGLAEGPYLILAGVVNPFSFVDHAIDQGFLQAHASPIASYVHDDGNLDDLSSSWDWTGGDMQAAVGYLNTFGRARWENFSNWRTLRDVSRWMADPVTPDRHFTPVMMDFWGMLGDYVRDAVRNVPRVRNFLGGLAKPGVDWRFPNLGVALLDDIALKPLVQDGQWTISAVFGIGLRLGRFYSIAAQYAGADEHQQRLMRANLFWAEADLVRPAHEVVLRYISAEEITEEPPILPIGQYEDKQAVIAQTGAFAKWFSAEFLKAGEPLMRQAFGVGLRCYAAFDPQFASATEISGIKAEAVDMGREWLRESAKHALGNGRDAARTAEKFENLLGASIPLSQGYAAVSNAIDALVPDSVLEMLLEDIPNLVDLWHPQLAHTLVPMTLTGQDWDWCEDQVRAARSRGEEFPCVAISAGGQIGIGIIPAYLAPKVENPDKEVIVASNTTGAEIFLVMSWSDLRLGKAPWLKPATEH
ncbi:hypothetical protein [Dyella caseinilytica]|uniref:DUF91 domain-containing protein n=1 Tax=Dyella caseinilytica TaxID=1849581 RepID=A0ABX7GP89_9GAMM|nr:hypothetical protein [Dyella caseinilytica]QRN52234.1 hypothetical protein ISN74_12115 [Dyella caseinilytica]GGA14236.1 hypothetical protein GCM10011408_39970 [Dyella caseinilytica]